MTTNEHSSTDANGGAGESTRLLVAIGCGAVLGGFLGWLVPGVAKDVAVVGTLWLRGLRMLVVPLIVASMIHGVSKLGNAREMRGLGGLTLGYYLCTSGLALGLGLLIVNVLQPGIGVEIGGAQAPDAALGGGDVGWQEMLTSLVTPNVVLAASETDLLPLILFSLAFGLVLPSLGESGRTVIRFFDGIFLAMMKLVRWLMLAAPIGVLGLVAGRFGEAGGGDAILGMLAGLGLFVVAVIGGLALHVLLVLIPILKFIGRRDALSYLRGSGPALVTAFASASSAATLPLTLQSADDNDVEERTSRVVLPLGATVNMDGSALYEAVAAMFIAQAWGIELGPFEQFLVFVTAILSSIGAAGIPEAGLVTMVIVLQAVGLPLEGLGLLIAIDWFLDRFRTAVNVWGDLVGASVVERLSGRPNSAPRGGS